MEEWNRQDAEKEREKTEREFTVARQVDPKMQKVIVQRWLYIGGGASGDFGEIKMREVHAERFVVPDALDTETKDAQEKRGEQNC